MGHPEMEEIADIIVSVLSHTKPTLVQKTGLPSKALCTTSPDILEAAQKRVADLLSRFPLYPEIVI
jgi:glycine hydroxymethyltransferase